MVLNSFLDFSRIAEESERESQMRVISMKVFSKAESRLECCERRPQRFRAVSEIIVPRPLSESKSSFGMPTRRGSSPPSSEKLRHSAVSSIILKEFTRPQFVQTMLPSFSSMMKKPCFLHSIQDSIEDL